MGAANIFVRSSHVSQICVIDNSTKFFTFDIEQAGFCMKRVFILVEFVVVFVAISIVSWIKYTNPYRHQHIKAAEYVWHVGYENKKYGNTELISLTVSQKNIFYTVTGIRNHLSWSC